MAPTIPTTQSGASDPKSQPGTEGSYQDNTDRDSTSSGVPSTAKGTDGEEVQLKVLELQTSEGQPVHVTAGCSHCVEFANKEQKGLADRIWDEMQKGQLEVRAPAPARGPSVDLDPAVDAATGSESTSGTDLAVKGWQALPYQAQHGIIGGVAGAGSLIIGGLLVKWAFFGEKGRLRRARAWALCLKCLGSDQIRR